MTERLDRRDAIKLMAAGATGAMLVGCAPGESGDAAVEEVVDAVAPPTALPTLDLDATDRYPFELPDLPYAHDALTAAIDVETMQIHHGKHHAGYTRKLNAALEPHAELHDKTIVELVGRWNELPETVQGAVRNNGGGFLNHTLFWPAMSAAGGGEPSGDLAARIARDFGSVDAFRERFGAAAKGQFGSGWAWLVADGDGALSVVGTPNQDSPVTDGLKPLLGLDVWEHAYYLRYQNRRGDYIDGFWNVVDWDHVARGLAG